MESFSHTMLRKITVSNTRQREKTDINDVASLMAHSTETANRHYHLQDEIAKARSGHEVVRELFGSPVKTKPEKKDEEAETSYEECNVTTTAEEPNTDAPNQKDLHRKLSHLFPLKLLLRHHILPIPLNLQSTPKETDMPGHGYLGFLEENGANRRKGYTMR